MSPYFVTQQLEQMLCDYTCAPFAVCVNSGSAALLLALERFQPTLITLPCRTYVSVPQEVLNAGHSISWEDFSWRGEYQLQRLPVWD